MAMWRQVLILGLMAILAGALTWRRIFPRTAPPVDTELVSGVHVEFVVVMPTVVSPSFTSLVRAARDTLRRRVISRGFTFGSIGVSDNWWVEKGLEDLAKIGRFDEVIVGRNWLNRGVEVFVTRYAARAAVPQVVVIARSIRVDTLPFQYSEPEVLWRAIGLGELIAWERSRFALALPRGAQRTEVPAQEPAGSRGS